MSAGRESGGVARESGGAGSGGGGLRLTVLGCTGSYPGPDQACSGYLVRGGGEVIMVDSGPGTVAALQHHVGLGELTAMVISHHHPDHWSDLGVLRVALRYGLGVEGLRVYGTAETLDIAAHLVGHDLAPTLDWVVVGGGDQVSQGPVKIRFAATDHYVPTVAVRVELEGRSLVYSADTGPGWSLSELGPAPEVALVEATLLAEQRQGLDADLLHLSASEAGEMALAAGCRRLLLTHQPPGADREAYRLEAEAAFGSSVELVRPHATYTV